MSTREPEMVLASADPVDQAQLDQLDLEGMEAELLADVDAERRDPSPRQAEEPPRRRERWIALLLAPAILAATAAAIVILAGGTSDPASRAYGAELVRFAESTPLLLLEGPGWRVQDVYEAGRGRYQPRGSRGEGSMEFVNGKPIPYESIRITGNPKAGERESGMLPASVRQRRVELLWRHGNPEQTIAAAHAMPHPHGQRWVRLPVLGTTASVDTRAEFFTNQGGPGNRQMTAFWGEDGYVLELRAAVPDLAAFEERLGWLTKEDSQTWLDAMPAKVVKATEHDAAVRQMLKGIPVPSTFKPSRVPDAGITTDRYQVGAAVTGIVSCLWFRQWGEAHRAGDRAAAREAEKAMATSRHWPILREMAKDGGYPETVWKLAAEMPSGHRLYAGHRWRLLPQAEALGCARWGVPVLPWKQRRQSEAEASRAR
jgi:hypothetical protein